MANGLFTISRGQHVKMMLDVIAGSGQFRLLLLSAAEVDDTLRRHPTLAALLAASGNTEATASNYARLTVIGSALSAPSIDYNSDVRVATFPAASVLWPTLGGAVNNTIVKGVICFAPTAGATDNELVPLCHWDINVATDGNDFGALGDVRVTASAVTVTASGGWQLIYSVEPSGSTQTFASGTTIDLAGDGKLWTVLDNPARLEPDGLHFPRSGNGGTINIAGSTLDTSFDPANIYAFVCQAHIVSGGSVLGMSCGVRAGTVTAMTGGNVAGFETSSPTQGRFRAVALDNSGGFNLGINSSQLQTREAYVRWVTIVEPRFTSRATGQYEASAQSLPTSFQNFGSTVSGAVRVVATTTPAVFTIGSFVPTVGDDISLQAFSIYALRAA